MILVNRYLLFVYDYHDSAGWADCVANGDDVGTLMKSLDYHIENGNSIVSAEAHIVDLATMKVVYRHSWSVNSFGWHAVDGLDFDDRRF